MLKDFIATDIYVGDSHNIAVSEEGGLYSWGGTMINSAWISSNANESKLQLMEDVKRRKVASIALAYNNTLIVTG